MSWRNTPWFRGQTLLVPGHGGVRVLLLAELKALGECPCGMYYFWQN